MTNQERLQQNNEKIEAIQQTLASKANIDVEAINNRITALETKDVELQNKDTEIESNIITLNSSVDSINTSLEEVIDTVNNLPTGAIAVKSEVFTGTFQELKTRLTELGGKLYRIKIDFNNWNPSTTTYQYTKRVAVDSTNANNPTTLIQTVNNKLLFKHSDIGSISFTPARGDNLSFTAQNYRLIFMNVFARLTYSELQVVEDYFQCTGGEYVYSSSSDVNYLAKNTTLYYFE